MELGKFLRMKRIAKKMSIRQLALYSGCSDSYLSMLERGVVGKRGPSPNFLRKLATPLGVPYEVLMDAAGYPLQKKDETLYTGSLMLMLRDSLGDEIEQFATRVGMTVQEIESLEKSGVSYETLTQTFRAIFGRQSRFTPTQKELMFRLEETFRDLPMDTSSHYENMLNSLLDLLDE